MSIWKDNVLGFVQPEEWLDAGFEVTRPNDPIDGLFDDQKTDNIVAYWQSIAAEYQIPVMAQFHGFDTEANTTFRIPVDTHNIEKGLIKVKINQSERMRELLRSGVSGDHALADYVLQDGVRLADQVVTRTKVAKNELMAKGKVTIAENNLDLTVDYGVPEEQTAYTIDLSEDADIAAQIEELVEDALDIGVTITGLMTSRKNITKIRKNTNIQTAINGAVGAGALVRMDALQAYLEEEFGISQVITNDLTYGASASIVDGRPVLATSRYYPLDKVTFFATNPSGRMGVGLWGNPPEIDATNFYPTADKGTEVPYVHVMQWMESDPAVLWTKASGLFMPVLYNPNSLWIASVAEEEIEG